MLIPGSELASFITAQQAQAVRSLQHTGLRPRLAIVQCGEHAPSDAYVRLKQRYGADIGVEVEQHKVSADELDGCIERLNSTEAVHGIIVQLPLPDGCDIDATLNLVAPEKDVDGLGDQSRFDPATPTAILWLLSGHNIELADKRIGIIGQGRLVGAPLARILRASGVEPQVCDIDSGSLEAVLASSDIVITATGQPRLITEKLIHAGLIIVDAGTASEDGSLVGDVDSSLYDRDDIKISPVPGGVGPLTVCALFGNVIEAFRHQVLG